FHIHPLNTLRGIAAEVERLGGRICESTAAVSTHLDGAEKRIATAGGEVRAPTVVVATGGYTGPLLPRLRRAVLPIATYMMASEPAPDLWQLILSLRQRVSLGAHLLSSMPSVITSATRSPLRSSSALVATVV